MQILSSRTAAKLTVLAAAGLLLPHLALAQMGVPNGAASSLMRPRTATTPKVAPPPALPGAAARPGSVAPPTEVPLDLSPNDALFDAINRGDIAAARDALSRGARLDSHNVLGLTPIELAVDLGRNDIAFLLLSMRGSGDSGASGPASTAAPPVQAAAAKPSPALRPAHATKLAARRNMAPVAPPAPPEQPKLFANDGGSPIPSIGFLGFGRRETP